MSGGFTFTINPLLPNRWGVGQVIRNLDPLTDVSNYAFGLLSRYTVSIPGFTVPSYGLWGDVKQTDGNPGNVPQPMVGVKGSTSANLSTGTVAKMVGVWGTTYPNIGGGAVSSAVGVQSTVTLPLGAGVTTAIGVQIDACTSGVATTLIGLSIGDQAATAADYAIYTGQGIVRFGDLVNITSGKGINLGDTTLKNYQEGSFTPTFTGLTVVPGTGGITWTGNYTRTGNVIQWQAQCVVTGTCTLQAVAGTTFLNNLPFSGSKQSVCSTTNTNGTAQGLGQALSAGVNAFMPTFGPINSNVCLSGTIYL